MQTSNLYITRNILFQGDVRGVVEFIKQCVKEKTETLCLKEYFKSDVWGVYVPGDEKFRYYYECIDNGQYCVFTVND